MYKNYGANNCTVTLQKASIFRKACRGRVLRHKLKKVQEVLVGVADAVHKKPCNRIKIPVGNLPSANFALLFRRQVGQPAPNPGFTSLCATPI
jgi:hypothetical protein